MDCNICSDVLFCIKKENGSINPLNWFLDLIGENPTVQTFIIGHLN